MSLYNKYRPKKFVDVLSQDQTVTILKNSIALKKVSHAYLFAGPKGTGKTTIARIFAKAVNCLQPKDGEPCGSCKNCTVIESQKTLDITEIDAASHTGVDNVRELKEHLAVSPSSLKYKVYIIDETHMLSTGAFNALLKSLEEPPSFVIFILATTEIHKVPATIVSRCQKFDFKRIGNGEIIKKLGTIAKKERVKINKEALMLIAVAAEGGMRDAESLLEQIIHANDEQITPEEVRDILGTPDNRRLHDFFDAIIRKDLQKGFATITELVYAGYDMGNYLKNLTDYARDILLLKINPDHATSLKEKMTEENLRGIKELSTQTPLPVIGRVIAELIGARNLMRDAPLPQLPLELALVRLIDADPGASLNVQKNPTKEEQKNERENKAHQEKPATAQSNSSAQKQKLPEDPPRAKKNEKLVKEQNQNESKKTEPAQSERAVAATTAIPAVNLEDIYRAWPKIIEGLKKHNHSLWGIIQNCQPIAIGASGEVIIRTKYNFHRDKLNELTNKKLINQVSKEVLACDCYFCYLLEHEVPEEYKKGNGSVVSDLLNDLGGEIVE